MAVESYWCTRHLLEAGANVSISDVNGKGFLQYLKRTSWANIFTKEELHSLKKLIEKLRPMLHISGQMDDLSYCSRANDEKIGRIIQQIFRSE